MKILAILAALSMAGVANAQTVTLGSEPCTRNQICYSVPNSGGLEINYIDWASQYGRLIISIGTVQYDSGLYAYPNLTAFTIYSPTGQPLSGSLNISISYGKCVQEGRVAVCPKYVTLVGGSLTQ